MTRLSLLVPFMVIVAALWARAALANDGKPLPSCKSEFMTDRGLLGFADPGRRCSEMKDSKGLIWKRNLDGTILANPYRIMELALADEKIKRGMISDPQTIVSNEKQIAELKKQLEPSPSQRRSVLALAEEIRKLLKERVRGDTSPSQLSPVQKKFMDRLTDLKISDQVSKDCHPYFPQATYDPERNVLTVCPSIMNRPLESLLPLIAHELGHAVDTCGANMAEWVPDELKRLREGKLDRLKSCGVPPDEARKLAISAIRRADEAPKGLVGNSIDFSLILIGIRCGFLQAPKNLFSKDSPGHPFASMQTCAAKVPPRRRSPLSENDGAEMAKELYGIELDPVFVSGQRNLFAHFNACHAEGGECYADHVGADLTANYLRSNWSKLPRGADSQLLATLTDGNCLSENKRLGNDAHLLSNARLAAYLEHPEIQSQVGCDGRDIVAVCPNPRFGDRPAAGGAARSDTTDHVR